MNTKFVLPRVLDEGLAEAISSILWVAPRLQDVPELKVISELLTAKYGKEYNMASQGEEYFFIILIIFICVCINISRLAERVLSGLFQKN